MPVMFPTRRKPGHSGRDRPLWESHLGRINKPKDGHLASAPSSVGDLSQQHALQLPDPAFLRQCQSLLCLLFFLQQLLDVPGGAQQDVARGLHGEDGPPQSLPGEGHAGQKATFTAGSGSIGGTKASSLPTLQKLISLLKQRTCRFPR